MLPVGWWATAYATYRADKGRYGLELSTVWFVSRGASVLASLREEVQWL